MTRTKTLIASIALCAMPAFARAQMMGPAGGVDATPIAVTLSSYEIQPSEIDLRHGVPYRLHLTNASGKAHNFSAPGLFAASQIAPQDQPKVEDGKIEVAGDESVDVAFVPMQPGEYEVHCTHFMHSMFGMHAKAVVQ